MSRITHLIGDRDGSQGPASSVPADTRFGWRRLDSAYSSCIEAEDSVASSLIHDFGVFVTRAGDRSQSHDLEVSGISRRRPRGSGRLHDAVDPGLYEVKTLWRRNENCAFDRRFKVGTRGEIIYGRRDSEIKRFALSLESAIDGIMEDNVADGLVLRDGTPGRVTEFVEASHRFIDDALTRRHSKSFDERLRRIAQASLHIPVLTLHARAVLEGLITIEDIRRGFHDIEGIFVVAGPMYTLVTKAEMGNLVTFDSASAEGPKLRMHGVIPSETNRTRKGKKQK